MSEELILLIVIGLEKKLQFSALLINDTAFSTITSIEVETQFDSTLLR